MSDEQKIADWCRFYEAATADYKPWALCAVLENDPALLQPVIDRLALTLPALLAAMVERPAAEAMTASHARRAKR